MEKYEPAIEDTIVYSTGPVPANIPIYPAGIGQVPEADEVTAPNE
ncbi:hypothetical protein [Cohnella sp. OV330]|nr:hypothetical protein [Cohnella sp. OV330]